jgi:hypothetical protein
VRPRNLSNLFRGPAGDDGPATMATLGPEVDDVIGGLDHVQVMLDDDHRVPGVHQPVEAVQQFLDVD